MFLNSSTQKMLKLIKHLPGNQLLVEWTNTDILKTLAVRFAGDGRLIKFEERSENNAHESRTLVVVFIISKGKNKVSKVPVQQSISSHEPVSPQLPHNVEENRREEYTTNTSTYVMSDRSSEISLSFARQTIPVMSVRR